MQRDLQHGVVLPARGQLLDRGDAMQSSARRRQLCVCVCGVLRLGWHGPEIKKDLSPSLNYAEANTSQIDSTRTTSTTSRQRHGPRDPIRGMCLCARGGVAHRRCVVVSPSVVMETLY
jgi:hypothetical protein